MLRACACWSSPTRFPPLSGPRSGRTSPAAPRRSHRSATRSASSRSARAGAARSRRRSRTPGLGARSLGAALAWRPDAILAHFLVPTGSIARRAAAVARVPYVLVAHGSDVANAEGSTRLRRATLSAVSDAASVVCVSELLAARLEELTGPLTGRLHVISAGVDTSRFHPGDRDVAATAIGWGATGPRICQLGNIVEVKNPLRLLDAFAELRRSQPGASLALVGDGPLREVVAERARALGIGDAVLLPGEVGIDEASRWLRAAHVCTPRVASRGLRPGCRRGARVRSAGRGQHRGRGGLARTRGCDGRTARPARQLVDRTGARAGCRTRAGRRGRRGGRSVLARTRDEPRGRGARRGHPASKPCSVRGLIHARRWYSGPVQTFITGAIVALHMLLAIACITTVLMHSGKDCGSLRGLRRRRLLVVGRHADHGAQPHARHGDLWNRARLHDDRARLPALGSPGRRGAPAPRTSAWSKTTKAPRMQGFRKVRWRGLEPPRPKRPLGPQPSASTNSATSAWTSHCSRVEDRPGWTA